MAVTQELQNSARIISWTPERPVAPDLRLLAKAATDSTTDKKLFIFRILGQPQLPLSDWYLVIESLQPLTDANITTAFVAEDARTRRDLISFGLPLLGNVAPSVESAIAALQTST